MAKNLGILLIASGRYVLIGLQKEAMCFSHPEFHKRETTLMSSRDTTKDDFIHVISALKKLLIKPKNYLTRRASFTEARNKFPSSIKLENKVIKAMTSF